MMRALPWLLAAGLTALAGLASLRPRTATLNVREHLAGAELLDHAEGRLYHRAVGSGSAVLMLPGFAGNSFTWQEVTPPLAARYRVHWLDLLGHGFSDKPPHADYRAAAQAQRIADVLAPRAPGRIAVVASSAGAQPAVALAARQPEWVAGMVLIDPFLAPSPGLEAALRAASRVPRATAVIMRALWRAPAFTWLGASLGRHRPWSVDAAIAARQGLTFATPGFYAVLPALLAGIAPEACRPLIPQVRCPVLLVWGASDRSGSGAQAQALANRFARASFALLDGAGHLPHEETPVALLALIEPFLASLAW